MDLKKYQTTHPYYKELDIPEYTLHDLKLVVPSISFAKESLSWVSDPYVMRYMGTDCSDVSEKGEVKRLTGILSNNDAYHWMILCDGKAIGNVNINEIEKISKEFGKKAGKLNYLIGDKTYWRKGMMTTVVYKVLDWAFTDAGFALIKSRALIQNIPSQSLLEKVGFMDYGKEIYDGPDIGEKTEYIAYKLPKEQW